MKGSNTTCILQNESEVYILHYFRHCRILVQQPPTLANKHHLHNAQKGDVAYFCNKLAWTYSTFLFETVSRGLEMAVNLSEWAKQFRLRFTSLD